MIRNYNLMSVLGGTKALLGNVSSFCRFTRYSRQLSFSHRVLTTKIAMIANEDGGMFGVCASPFKQSCDIREQSDSNTLQNSTPRLVAALCMANHNNHML